VGDSQLNRFARYCKVDSSVCFPGNSISELRSKLKHLGGLPQNIILLIGSNDLKRDVDEHCLKRDYRALVKFIIRNCKRVILVATPVIPKRAWDPNHFVKLQVLNDMLYSFQSDSRVSVVDLRTYSEGEITKPEFFERYYYDGRRDMLHLNALAFDFLLELLQPLL